MNEFSEYEYTVTQKIEGAWRLKRLGMLALYVAFVIGWFVFGFVTNLYALIALCPLTLYILVLATWRYVSLEYRYETVSGTFTFFVIYGGKKRKKITEFKIKDCTAIVPLTEAKHQMKLSSPEVTYSALSSKDARDVYVALYEENGKRTALFFEATEKALKICSFYNSHGTVITKVRF